MSLANLLTGDSCSVGGLYSHPMVEAVLGGSLHPGGLDLTLEMCKDLGPDDHLLDVGCGKGESARAVAEATGCRVTGVDVSEASIAEARTRTANDRIFYQVLPNGRLDGLTDTFDAILSECVLCLQGDPGHNLREYARLLRPGGRLLLSDVTVEAPADSFRSAAGFVACLGGAMPYTTLTGALEAADFEVESATQRTDLVQQVRDRIHRRVDVPAIMAALGDQISGLQALISEAETALASGHLSYAVISATRR